MSNKLSFQIITGTEQTQNGVVSLPIRPNQPTQYGEPGFSAKQLQQHFDALAVLISKRYNNLIEGLNGQSATRYLSLPEGIALSDIEEATVYDLLHRLVTAQGVLKSIDPETSDEAELSEIIYNIWADLEDALAFLQLDEQTDSLGTPISIVDKYATIASLTAETVAREQADEAIHTRIDNEVLAEDTGAIDVRISAHNTSTSNHADIRENIADITKSGGTIDSRISAHNIGGATHQDIRTSVDNISKDNGLIDTKISAHNVAGSTHEDIREAISDIIEEDDGTIDSRISAHNAGTTTHADIRLQLANKMDKSSIVVNEGDLSSAQDSQVPSARLFYELKTIIDEFFGAPDTDSQLDRLSEIVKYLKENDQILENIRDNKVDKTAVVTSVNSDSTDSQIPSAKLLYDNYIPKTQIVTAALGSSSTDDQVPSAKRIYSSYFLKSNISNSSSTSKTKVFSAKYVSDTFAKKTDLDDYATVGDLNGLATKGDLASFATTGDLEPLIDGDELSLALAPYLKSKDAAETYTTEDAVKNLIAQANGGAVSDTSIVKSTDELAKATNDQVPSAKLLYETYITKGDAEKYTTEPEVKEAILGQMIQSPSSYDKNVAKDNIPTSYTVSMNVLHNRFVTKAQLDKKLEDYVPNIDIPTLPEVVTSLDDPSTDKVLSAATGGLIKDKIQSSLNGYATEEYVNQAVEDIDISKNLDAILAPYVTEQELKDAISTVDINIPSDLLGKLEFIFGGGGSWGLKYRLYADHAECLGLGVSEDLLTDTEVTIANYIGNKPVTHIYGEAFMGCSRITKVTIPSKITSIGNSAFEECVALKDIVFNATAANDLEEMNYIFLNAGTLSGGFAVTIGKNVTKIPNNLLYSSNYTPSKVKNIRFEKGSICHTIGAGAFANCAEVERITIPDSVTSIGDYAFYNCSNLTSITIPNSVTSIGDGAFSGCSMLPMITLPETINNIGKYAFNNCNSIASIEFPDNTEYIGMAALAGCSSLSSITIPFVGDQISPSYNPFGYIFGTVQYSDSYLVSQPRYNLATQQYEELNYYIPSTLRNVTITKSLGSFRAFKDCRMEEVTIGENVTTLGMETFKNCSSVTTITYNTTYEFEGSITAFNDMNATDVAFVIGHLVETLQAGLLNNINTKQVIFNSNPADGSPPKMREIANDAFSGCNITAVILPEGVISIGENAFKNCSNLQSITIPSTVSLIGANAFRGCLQLRSITIPYGVTSIYDRTFAGCEAIVSVTIPESITYIGDFAFSTCTSLTAITIPDSVTSIGAYAFEGCTSLANITMGSGVENIGEAAFMYCRISNVWIKSIDAWLDIVFADEFSNPLYYGASLYINGTRVTTLTIPSIRLVPGEWTRYEVGYYAFYGCSSITGIRMVGDDNIYDSGIHILHNYCFANCEKLKYVIMPIAIDTIGQSIVENCNDLEAIYYLGSESLWNQVEIQPYNDKLMSTPVYYYMERQPTTEGKYWHFDDDGNPSVWDEIRPTVGLSYSLKSDGTYEFTGRGSSGNPEIRIAKTYDGAAVTSIAARALENDAGIVSVIIPNSVTSIGGYAFSGCSNLTRITIPNSVISIGGAAFGYCKGLTSITIPDSVTSIGDEAFLGCNSLARITIGNGVTSIGKYAFYQCSVLKDVMFDESSSLANIDQYAFAESGIKNITIPNSVTTIGNYAFKDSALISAIIGDGVTSIGQYAFADCGALETITVGSGVQSVGEYAFYNCYALTGVYIKDLSKWCNIMFGYSEGSEESMSSNPLGYAHYLYINDTLVENLKIPEGIEFITQTAFYGCANIKSIIIPNSVTSIGELAFYGCSQLKDVDLGVYDENNNHITSKLSYIDREAFDDCPKIETVLYNGSKSMWQNITIREGNDSLRNATILYWQE